MRGTLVLLLALFVGLSTSSEYSNRQWTSDSQVDASQKPAKPFQSGYQYIYTYNGQMSSGLGNTPNQQQDEGQKAVSRIEAQAKITFSNSQSATLRLQNIRMGQANQPINDEKEVQPMGMFERKQVPQDKRQQLELAVNFEYVNGVVGQINFQTQDPVWARNIKRSVLNLLQVNLNQQGGQQQQWDEQDQDSSTNGQSGPSKSFTTSETTIEGNCETTYTVNPNNKPGQQEEDQFNVTKTINFRRCQQIADVAYGYQTQQQSAECASCQQPCTNTNEQPRQQPSAQCQKCDPKQIKEQQLSRSTIIRFVLQGRQQNYAIQRAEMVSQYIYNNMDTDGNYPSGLQTVVAAQLVFQECQSSNDQGHNIPQSNKANTLLFDNQWDVEEKRFYQLGDESSRTSPFAEVPQKVEQAEQIIRRLVQAASDKQNGIEFHQLAKLQRLVEIFRMCSVEELEQIMSQSRQSPSTSRSYSRSEGEQQKQQQLVADCLAMAGTRNTIQMLADKITNADFSANVAMQALKGLQGLPAPSDEQVEIVQRLCQHQTVHRSSALKQTCWLTFGSMVSELCQENTGKQEGEGRIFGTQTGFQPKQDMCRTDKKQKYKQALEQQYEQAQNTYEKVLTLKAIGNAGLDICIPSLQVIIVDGKQDPIVRTQAVDAFRRLRTQMPQKIQQVLLPIFQNTKEQPEVRMAAFGMIMQTRPQQSILDQFTYTLTQESQPEVQSLVYSVMKTLSNSKIPEDQNIAKHLKNCLKLANVDEQSLRPSRKYQVPIYSHEQKNGVFLNFWSAYRNSRSQLPSYLSAGVDTLLNSEYQTNSFKMFASQQNIEKWYETVLEKFIAATKQGSSMNTRGHRFQQSNSKNNNKEELRNILSGLQIRNRRANQQGGGQQEEPFAMVCVRVADVDQVILPIDQNTMPECLKPVLNGERPSLSEWMHKLQNTQHFRLLTTMNMKEKTARIPTSMGVSLSVVQAMPMMASIEGSLNVKMETSHAESPMAIKTQLKLHPSVSMTYIQKMESWLPMFATGVTCTQAIELNLPIQAEIKADQQQGVSITIEVPQTPNTQLVGVHSLPSTYTREWDESNKMMKDPKVKVINNPQLEQCQQNVQKEIGKQYFGMPLQLSSQWHLSCTKSSSYSQLLQLMMASENHYQLSFNPQANDGTPKKIIFQVNGKAFQKVSGSGHGPELTNFYSDSQEFQKAHPEDNFEDMNLDGNSQRRQKFNTYMDGFQTGQMYQHSLEVKAKTEGGRKQCSGKIDLKTSCDAQFKFCKSFLEVERSPLLEENQEWRLKAKMQVMQPQLVNHVEEIGQGKHQKLVCQMDCDWGTNGQQNINFRVQGEQAISRQQRQENTSQQQKKQSAFLNKFDITAEYTLQPAAQNTFLRGLELLKCNDPWNTQSLLHQSGKHGQVHATLVIDPISSQQANISISTPNQKVRMEAVELKPFGEPLQMRPFPLVRSTNKHSHSAQQMVKQMAVDNAPRAKCTVDGRKVQTFDGAVYKAPIGKCYTVLSKDCSDEPRFAVMMKAHGEDQASKDKKVKVITADQTIKCNPAGSGSSKKLECFINDQLVDPQQQQQSLENNNGVVEFNNEEQTDVSIQVEEGVQVRMSCSCSKCKCQKVEVRLSQQYKQGQCGLCGHYDDQADDENELRMSNNQNTNDLAEFHRSYTIKDDCSNQEMESLYSNKNKFGKVNRRSKKSNYNSQDSYQQEEEEDNEWQQGGYHSQEQQDNQWESNRQQMWNNQQGGRRQQGQNSQDNQEEPIEQTRVLEFSHKICFSVQPVKVCPEGSSPASGEEDIMPNKKIQFACVSRGSMEARQMQRQARRGLTVNVSNLTPSFVEAVQQPSQCVAY